MNERGLKGVQLPRTRGRCVFFFLSPCPLLFTHLRRVEDHVHLGGRPGDEGGGREGGEGLGERESV